MNDEPGPPSVHLTGRAALLLLSAAGFLGVGILVHDVALLFLGVPLLLAPLAAYVAAPSTDAPARLVWEGSGSGREVRVEGRLTLPDGVDAAGVRIRLSAPGALDPVAPARYVRSPGAVAISLAYEAEFPCLAILPRPDVEWRDPFGLVERPLRVEGAALRLERFPPELARLRARHLRRTTVYPGEVLSRHRGGSGDFFAIRPSVAGDTPRQINWAASARARRWLANDYLLERTGDLLIVLDLRPTPLGAARDTELLAMGRAAAYGIASAFLSEKARVGLATFGEYVEALPLGSGRLQRFRIRRALQNAHLSESAGPAERLGASLPRYFPKGIGTLVISSLSDDEAPVMLAHARRRGYAPFVLAPSPLPLIAPVEARTDRRSELAARLLHLARRQRLAAAWAEAPVVDWEEYWSLAPFVRFLSRPAGRGGGIG